MCQEYFGLPHETLGSARLSRFDVQGLILSNIGRSGYDGLGVGLENIDFWEGSFSFVPMDTRPADASTDVGITGSTLTTDGVNLFHIRYHLGGDSLVLTVDNSGLEPRGQKVQVLRGEEVMKEVTLSEAAFAIDLPPVGVIKSTFQGGCKFEFWKKQKNVEQAFQFSEVISIGIADEEILEADRILITPQQSVDVETFVKLEARAASIRAIIIFDESTTMPLVDET